MARRLRAAAGEIGRDLPHHEALVRSIRRWESGQIGVLSERYRLLFCQAFGMEEDDLFAEANAAVPETSSNRSFAAEQVTAWPRDGATQHDLSAMISFRGADKQVGGGHLYATVMGYLERDVAPRLVGGCDGRSVFVTAAAFTEMVGWMAHDAGQDATANRHFSRALDLVGIGGDRQLAAHILGSMSHLAQHCGRPAEAVRLARRGTEMLADTDTSAPVMEARLLSMAARGFASLGDSAESARLLLRAERILDHDQISPPSPWAGPFDEGALALDTARSMLALGQLREARRQAERAIALRSGNRTRSRALGQLLLARVLLTQGDAEQACRVAGEAIADTRSLGSLVVTRQLADMRGLLQAYREQQIVGEFLVTADTALEERRWLWRGAERGPRRPAV